ncbi:hypothetical protein EDD16DRAFT_6650 [Pisolithus croceorrhizus]|nr:hypothetical protein EV401DRAFT_218055 [Pisolithus croceorrhizus]KAI6133135.1 hypothetical protein EDD16DRAFT_6650 [Pisolithus croceorrhizus]
MDHDLRLVYFPLRGRGEPILLLLVDSGVPFDLEEIPLVTWKQWKKTRQITNDKFPYSALPVLHASHRVMANEPKTFVFAETSAILTYLDEILDPTGTTPERELPLEVRVRIQMVKEASLFAVVRIFGMARSSEWLAPPQRTTIWGIVNRYLRDTENTLSELEKSIRVVPLQTDRLTGMTAAAATTITLVTQVFPSTREMLGNDGEYKRCGKLWTAVLERPRIAAYWEENKIEAKPWSITEYGTAEWIARAAASFDRPQPKL